MRYHLQIRIRLERLQSLILSKKTPNCLESTFATRSCWHQSISIEVRSPSFESGFDTIDLSITQLISILSEDVYILDGPKVCELLLARIFDKVGRIISFNDMREGFRVAPELSFKQSACCLSQQLIVCRILTLFEWVPIGIESCPACQQIHGFSESHIFFGIWYYLILNTAEDIC